MSQNLTKGIEEHFKFLPDPRKKTANQRHKFLEILIIAICVSGKCFFVKNICLKHNMWCR